MKKKIKIFIIDFFTKRAQDWWSKWIKDFHSNVSFDGLWIDMNEPGNFLF